MAKVSALSPQTRAGVELLGLEIARARRARRWSQAELAERAGVSVLTIRSIERGSPSVAIGTVFEVAALLGLNLFDASPQQLPTLVTRSQDRLALLPTRVRTRSARVEDDF